MLSLSLSGDEHQVRPRVFLSCVVWAGRRSRNEAMSEQYWRKEQDYDEAHGAVVIFP